MPRTALRFRRPYAILGLALLGPTRWTFPCAAQTADAPPILQRVELHGGEVLIGTVR